MFTAKNNLLASFVVLALNMWSATMKLASRLCLTLEWAPSGSRTMNSTALILISRPVVVKTSVLVTGTPDFTTNGRLIGIKAKPSEGFQKECFWPSEKGVWRRPT